MTINAEALRLMREKGLSLDDVVEIASAMEARRDRTGAERQQRYRERHKVTRDVTRDEPPIERDHTPADFSNEKPAKARKRAAPAEIEIPEWVPAKPWADFVAMRLEIKKPLTPGGAPKLIEKLSEISQAGWDITKVLDKSTVNLWRGLFMPTPGRDDDMRAGALAKPIRAYPPEYTAAVTALSGERDRTGMDMGEYLRRHSALRVQFGIDDGPKAQPPPERRNGSGPRNIGSIMGKMNIAAPTPDDPQAEAVG